MNGEHEMLEGCFFFLVRLALWGLVLLALVWLMSHVSIQLVSTSST